MNKLYKLWFSSFVCGKYIAFPVGMWVLIAWLLTPLYAKMPDMYFYGGIAVIALITLFGRGRRYYNL